MAIQVDLLKKEWLEKLARVHSGWNDGDAAPGSDSIKTADCVNAELCVAIEIKQDKRKYLNCLFGFSTIRNQLKTFAREANKKFVQYPAYKTCLIIQTPLDANGLGRLFPGHREILEMQSNLAKVSSVRNRFFSPKFIEVGAYLLYENTTFYFLKNPIASDVRRMSIDCIRQILDISKIEEVAEHGPMPFGI